jgi:protein farnesyltransferase/geranylgeranyltransferase type-1 subunit alpha
VKRFLREIPAVIHDGRRSIFVYRADHELTRMGSAMPDSSPAFEDVYDRSADDAEYEGSLGSGDYDFNSEPDDPLPSFDWTDLILVPMPQTADDPFFTLYSDEYVQVFGRFHAILNRQELSPRALAICNHIITQWPKHITAWWYKFHLLEALGYDFEYEMDLLRTALGHDPKSYQGWHYRRWLVSRNLALADELPLLAQVLDNDHKNYHAWSYAVWFAQAANQEQAVYDLALRYIELDCRNNSAWNTRKTVGESLGVDATAEFEAAVASLREVGKNEAAFNFMKAMTDRDAGLKERLRSVAEELIGLKEDNRYAWVLLLSQTTEQGEISRICDRLIELDSLRTPYYNLVKQGVIRCA